MKVLLVKPRDRDDINTRLPETVNRRKGIFPPLGIAYIASYIRQEGVKDVSILDAEALNMTNQDIEEYIAREKPDIVGYSCMTTVVPHALKMARFAKEQGCINVLGGPHINAFPRESMHFDYIDYAFVGEGEISFLELIRELEKKEKKEEYSFNHIKGLIYRKDGDLQINGYAIVEDLDSLPFPAFDLLPMEKYFSVTNDSPFVTMMSTRGCPFKCGFCYKQASERVYRIRSPKNVVDEIEQWIKVYKLKEVMFYDDTLTLKKENVMGICDEIIKRGIKIKWEGPTRVDCVDEPLLRRMKEAGCNKLRYGVESGDKRILRLMRKGTNLELIEKIFKLSKKVGLETFAYFIIGYYSETPETMQNTIDFAKRIEPDWAMFTVATPYPETHLHDLTVNAGLIDGDYWVRLSRGEDVGRMPHLVKDANKWAKKAYLQFYFRPGLVWNKVKKINSVDEFKRTFTGALSILGI